MRKQRASLPNPERSQVLTKALLRASEILGLNQTALAQVVGLSTASVSRMRSGIYHLDPASKEWELAALMVRLYRGLDAVMAGDEQALQAWMGNYNNDLHEIPATLIATVAGLVKTVEYVDAFRARI